MSAKAADDSAPKPPLRIIVATAAGGVPDSLARTIGQQITQSTGRAVIVENRVGAGGAVAANAIMGAPADGSSMLLIEGGAYSMVPHMSKIDVVGRLAPVGLAAYAPIFLCAHPDLGVSTIPEFIAYAKAHPGLAFGSSGIGSWHHIAMEMMARRAGIQLTHVPYKGASQTVVALIAGEVRAAFLGYSTAMPQLADRKLRVLGVGSLTRSRLAPQIPPLGEAGGFPFDMRDPSLFVFAHPNTAPSHLESLNRLLAAATRDPEVDAKLARLGIEGSEGKLGYKEFAAFVRDEFQYYAKVIKPLRIELSQ